MLTQYVKRTTQTDSINDTFITLVVMLSTYTMNNTFQNTKNLNHKTYRFKKLNLPEIRTKNQSQTHTQTGLTTRYEKPYQNRTVIRKNAQYGTISKTQRINEFMRNKQSLYYIGLTIINRVICFGQI